MFASTFDSLMESPDDSSLQGRTCGRRSPVEDGPGIGCARVRHRRVRSLAGSGCPHRPEPGSPTANVNTVTLRVPKGELSGTLNIVDASGGELATLTLLSTGETAVAARRGGTGWGLAFTGNGTARMEVVGPVRVTDIEMDPDGTTRISTRERLTGKVPREDDAIGTGQMN